MKICHFQDDSACQGWGGEGGKQKICLHTFEPFMAIVTDRLGVFRMIKTILIFGINILYAWLIPSLLESVFKS
jgi:hypothetical protein